MTNYFKVYLKSKSNVEAFTFKKKEDVVNLLNKANKQGYESYIIIKRLKQGTDLPIARGTFSTECEVVYVDGLDTDWRVVGHNVVLWDKYKEEQKSDKGENR